MVSDRETICERRGPSLAHSPAQTAGDVREWLTRVYGEDPSHACGVVHIVACMRGSDGRYHVLKIGPEAPKSETDFFLLQATRARAAVVLTTAENLRSEPHLSHDFVGPSASALAAYRHEVVGLRAPLQVVILSRSGELPSAHPVWSDSAHKRVFTVPERVSGLRAQLPKHVSVEPFDGDVRAAVKRLCAEGAQTISIEAGPRTASLLYADSPMVTEVCVSVCVAARPGEVYEGAPLPPDDRLFQGLSCAQGCYETNEPSGPWLFARHSR